MEKVNIESWIFWPNKQPKTKIKSSGNKQSNGKNGQNLLLDLPNRKQKLSGCLLRRK